MPHLEVAATLGGSPLTWWHHRPSQAQRLMRLRNQSDLQQTLYTLSRHLQPLPVGYRHHHDDGDALRREHSEDLANILRQCGRRQLPAISMVKAGALATAIRPHSKLDLFEGSRKRLVTTVQSNSDLWASTAIIIRLTKWALLRLRLSAAARLLR